MGPGRHDWAAIARVAELAPVVTLHAAESACLLANG